MFAIFLSKLQRVRTARSVFLPWAQNFAKADPARRWLQRDHTKPDCRHKRPDFTSFDMRASCRQTQKAGILELHIQNSHHARCIRKLTRGAMDRDYRIGPSCFSLSRNLPDAPQFPCVAFFASLHGGPARPTRNIYTRTIGLALFSTRLPARYYRPAPERLLVFRAADTLLTVKNESQRRSPMRTNPAPLPTSAVRDQFKASPRVCSQLHPGPAERSRTLARAAICPMVLPSASITTARPDLRQTATGTRGCTDTCNPAP